MSDLFPADRETRGDAEDAVAWVTGSALVERDKERLLTFVRRFPALAFVRDRPGMLKRLERRDEVRLPAWFHGVRAVLRSVEPLPEVRFDGFDDFDDFSPRIDYVDEIWYSLELGYLGEGQRSLFVEKTRVYPIGEWEETDRSYLAVRLDDTGDGRILEFAAPDLRDNLAEGKSPNVSVRPVFDSYASMLSHVVEVRLPDGTVVAAR